MAKKTYEQMAKEFKAEFKDFELAKNVHWTDEGVTTDGNDMVYFGYEDDVINVCLDYYVFIYLMRDGKIMVTSCDTNDDEKCEVFENYEDVKNFIYKFMEVGQEHLDEAFDADFN